MGSNEITAHTQVSVPFQNAEGASQADAENMPANAGYVRDTGSIPGSARSPGEGNGNPLQFSCLEIL